MRQPTSSARDHLLSDQKEERDDPTFLNNLLTFGITMARYYYYASFSFAMLSHDTFNMDEVNEFINPSDTHGDSNETSPFLNPLFWVAFATAILPNALLVKRLWISNLEGHSRLHQLTEEEQSLYPSRESNEDHHRITQLQHLVTTAIMAVPFYGIGHAAGGALVQRFVPQAADGWHYFLKFYVGTHVALGGVAIHGLEASRHGNPLTGLYKTFCVTPFENKTRWESVKNIVLKLLVVASNLFEAKYGSEELVRAEPNFFGSAGLTYIWVSAVLDTLFVGLTEASALDEQEAPSIQRENLTPQEQRYSTRMRAGNFFSGIVHSIPPTIGVARILADAAALDDKNILGRILALSLSGLTIGIPAAKAFAAMLGRVAEHQISVERRQNFREVPADYGTSSNSSGESIQLQLQ